MSVKPTDLVGRIGVSVTVGVLVLLYFATFQSLAIYWATNDIYSYAYIVPVISGFLVWTKRSQWGAVPAQPSLVLGGSVVLLGLLMLLAGRLSSTNLLEQVSFVVTICGLTLLLFGRRIFRIVAFPLTFLLSMVPFWEFLTNRLHWPFQLYSAIIGVGSLRMFGVPVLREGIYIELPNVTLEVAEACSGVNNLIAVLCLGVPVTYLAVRSWPKRLFIVAMAILIALLSNAVRVAVVSLLAYHDIRGADGDIHGPFSLLRSFLISGIGFVALFWLIFRLADDGNLLDQATRAGWQPPLPHISRAPLFLALVILGSGAAFERWHHIDSVPLARALQVLPERIGTWDATPTASFPSDLAALDFDERLSRNYRSPSGAELNLFLGYFQTQVQGRELASFEMRTALTGRAHASYTATDGRRLSDFLSVSQRGTFHVTYWYLLDGRTASTHYGVKLRTAWNSMLHGQTGGAVVVVKTKVSEEESVETARLRVHDFIEGYLARTPRTRG